jgi:uncharacterized protein YdaU (DUF1376 family)
VINVGSPVGTAARYRWLDLRRPHRLDTHPPQGVYMAEFPALPLFTDAYLADTRHLTTLQHGAYLLMLMTAWRSSDCSLPNDDAFLARIAGLDKRTWNTNRTVLLSFWQLNGQQKWEQGRLKDERNYVGQVSQTNSANAKSRWLKNNNSLYAIASVSHSDGNAPTPTPTPKDNLPLPLQLSPTEFDSFWEKFPRQRRGNKEKAHRAWKRALQRATEQEVMHGLETYLGSSSVRDGYAKGAEAWLNDDGWTYRDKPPATGKRQGEPRVSAVTL